MNYRLTPFDACLGVAFAGVCAVWIMEHRMPKPQPVAVVTEDVDGAHTETALQGNIMTIVNRYGSGTQYLHYHFNKNRDSLFCREDLGTGKVEPCQTFAEMDEVIENFSGQALNEACYVAGVAKRDDFIQLFCNKI